VLHLQSVGSATVYLKYAIVCAVRNLLLAFRTFNNLDIVGYYWGDQNMEGWVVEGGGKAGDRTENMQRFGGKNCRTDSAANFYFR
jgi:hypothetical protein